MTYAKNRRREEKCSFAHKMTHGTSGKAGIIPLTNRPSNICTWLQIKENVINWILFIFNNFGILIVRIAGRDSGTNKAETLQQAHVPACRSELVSCCVCPPLVSFVEQKTCHPERDRSHWPVLKWQIGYLTLNGQTLLINHKISLNTTHLPAGHGTTKIFRSG